LRIDFARARSFSLFRNGPAMADQMEVEPPFQDGSGEAFGPDAGVEGKVVPEHSAMQAIVSLQPGDLIQKDLVGATLIGRGSEVMVAEGALTHYRGIRPQGGGALWLGGVADSGLVMARSETTRQYLYKWRIKGEIASPRSR
jgi:hypothetical protein